MSPGFFCGAGLKSWRIENRGWNSRFSILDPQSSRPSSRCVWKSWVGHMLAAHDIFDLLDDAGAFGRHVALLGKVGREIVQFRGFSWLEADAFPVPESDRAFEAAFMKFP